MVSKRMSVEERRRTAGERLEAAQEALAAEVAALVSGEDWQRFLGFQARLHAYSPSNVLLLARAHAEAFADGMVTSPDPGWVAGFVAWQGLGRSVERGQHRYPILAPCRYNRRVAVDGEGEARPLANSEVLAAGEHVERRQVLAGFRVERVFSVQQTRGRPLPEVPAPELLEGEAPDGLETAVAGVIERRGFTVDTVPDAAAIDGANGRTQWDTRRVVVRADMDEAARVKTLLHEAGHVLLHAEGTGRELPRAVKEVEAESVAFVVAAVHGMATDGYSFPYVAGWAGTDSVRAVQATQSRVAGAARTVIDASPAVHGTGGRPPGVTAAVGTHEVGAAAPVPIVGRPTVEVGL
jgi:hypothetical protein